MLVFHLTAGLPEDLRMVPALVGLLAGLHASDEILVDLYSSTDCIIILL